ncbi:MAG: nicotinate-nucleotide--dimethylbenzimidazole phosphoribosyltransferase [Oscillospiraceae bacterium]
MTLYEALKKIKPSDKNEIKKAKIRFNSIAKPIDSMGKLEDIIIKCSGIMGSNNINFEKKCVVVMCADNGIIEENVSQSGNDVTTIVAKNIAMGNGNVNVIARTVGADVFAIDIGIKDNVVCNGLEDKKIMNGTNNMLRMPVMTREDCIKAIEVGINKVFELKNKGYSLIATGEMGIGNTTTASAIACTILGASPYEIAGKGAGLPRELVHHKAEVIAEAIKAREVDSNDPVDVLSKVGGLDIAGLTGIFIGGAVFGVAILIDGVISAAAALCAAMFNENIVDYMFSSHLSVEKSADLILKRLGLVPLANLEMCLGEGTGAVCVMPFFDIGANVYNEMSSFDDFCIEQYEVFEK